MRRPPRACRQHLRPGRTLGSAWRSRRLRSVAARPVPSARSSCLPRCSTYPIGGNASRVPVAVASTTGGAHHSHVTRVHEVRRVRAEVHRILGWSTSPSPRTATAAASPWAPIPTTSPRWLRRAGTHHDSARSPPAMRLASRMAPCPATLSMHGETARPWRDGPFVPVWTAPTSRGPRPGRHQRSSGRCPGPAGPYR